MIPCWNATQQLVFDLAHLLLGAVTCPYVSPVYPYCEFSIFSKTLLAFQRIRGCSQPPRLQPWHSSEAKQLCANLDSERKFDLCNLCVVDV